MATSGNTWNIAIEWPDLKMECQAGGANNVPFTAQIANSIPDPVVFVFRIENDGTVTYQRSVLAEIYIADPNTNPPTYIASAITQISPPIKCVLIYKRAGMVYDINYPPPGSLGLAYQSVYQQATMS